MDRHLNTLQLHQLRYGELEEDVRKRARLHLDTCDSCARRFRAQQAERAAFVLQPVPPALQAAPRRSWSRHWSGGVFTSLAALAAVLALAMTQVSVPTGPQTVESTRAKGALPSLEVWIDGPQGPRPLRLEESVGAGERIQVLFDPQGHRWVTFAGQDGAGSWERYGAVEPKEGGLQPAPFALTLDDTPGDQRLFILAGDRALALAEVRDAVEQGATGFSVTETAVPRR
jgi:hypothetical protein